MNVLLCGVGGQGVLTMSRVICEAARRSGLDIFVGETLGMSQRGGRVHSHVRLGEDALGPLIPKGMAHLIVSLEFSESLSALPYASSIASAVVCDVRILPISALLGGKYPSEEEVLHHVGSTCGKAYLLKTDPVRRLGLSFLNSFVLGFLQANEFLPFDEKTLLSSLLGVIGKKTEENKEAFRLGKEAEALAIKP